MGHRLLPLQDAFMGPLTTAFTTPSRSIARGTRRCYAAASAGAIIGAPVSGFVNRAQAVVGSAGVPVDVDDPAGCGLSRAGD